jgi:dolichol-phosphate mannosyltransferase
MPMQPQRSDSADQPKRLEAPWVRQFIGLAQRFRHLIPFALVGVSGLLVNSAILAAATRAFGLQMLTLSTALSTLGSTTWNFTLTEVWVFRDRRRPGWPRRLVMFFVMNNAALLLRVPIINELTFGLGIHYLVSNVLSIGAVTLVRYLFSDALIWRSTRKREPALPAVEEKKLG